MKHMMKYRNNNISLS